MVAAQIRDRRPYLHRHALFAEIIILGYGAARHFIVIANVIRRHTARYFLYTLAVGILK